jgi:hypothetical protein
MEEDELERTGAALRRHDEGGAPTAGRTMAGDLDLKRHELPGRRDRARHRRELDALTREQPCEVQPARARDPEIRGEMAGKGGTDPGQRLDRRQQAGRIVCRRRDSRPQLG